MTEGEQMHALATKLFPIGRSLTGSGVRETLAMLQTHIPLVIHEVPSGTPVCDWTVPQEWSVREAYIVTPDGKRIADYAANNLHLVGYSLPINAEMPLVQLQEHLHSIENQPDAIPYVTSYYAPTWGFCLTHKERQSLTEGTYQVHIDSTLADGSLTYADMVIPGESAKEILISTYVCHPSMANNELSGPVLAVALAQWVMQKKRKYTYRFVFIPEIIGSLTYLSTNLELLQQQMIAGFVLTCVGDEKMYSYMPSREGGTLADHVALRTMRREQPDFTQYSYLERGSDERTYCAPGADLPVVSITRSRYGKYPEYHTSLDDLTFVTAKGLQGSFDVHRSCLELLESEPLYQAAQVGEPQLGRRGLYPTLSKKGSVGKDVQLLLDVLAYADGTRLPQDIADVVGRPLEVVRDVCLLLKKHGLLLEV
jgi:aminopeptidase-like protein